MSKKCISFQLLLSIVLLSLYIPFTESCNKLNMPAPAGPGALAAKTKTLQSSFLQTPVIYTLAGNGTPGFADGASAVFNQPAGVAVDAAGNVYVADKANNRIRKITAAGIA